MQAAPDELTLRGAVLLNQQNAFSTEAYNLKTLPMHQILARHRRRCAFACGASRHSVSTSRSAMSA